MESGIEILNDNGKTYTVIELRGPDTLLSYETPHGIHYVIAWRLQLLINKHFAGRSTADHPIYVWQQGHYFNENLADAQRAMITRESERQAKIPRKFIHIR